MSQVALITGGASGFGLATAEAFARDGWSVAILDINAETGEQMARQLNGKFYQANVADWRSLSAAFAHVWKDFRRLDFVFANAGTVERADFFAQQPSDLDGLPPELSTSVIDINLRSVYISAYLALHFFRKNLKPGGALVITASTAGLYNSPTLPLYSGTKYGVIGFMRSIAEAVGQEGITANCVCPAAVRTNLFGPETWDQVPSAMFTPIQNVVNAVRRCVDDRSINGMCLEVVLDQVTLIPTPEDRGAMRAVNNANKTVVPR